MVKHQSITNLGRMVGLQSIKRNLKAEDDAIKKDMQKFGDMMHSEDQAASGDSDDETGPMEIMAANDVHIHNGPREESQNPDANADMERLLRAAMAGNKQPNNGLRNALITGALAGGIPLAGIAGYALNSGGDSRPDTPVPVVVEENKDKSNPDNTSTIRFLD